MRVWSSVDGEGEEMAPKTAAAFDVPRVSRYWKVAKETFRDPAAGPTFSIVQDATRVGGLDMQFSALWSSALSMAIWLPPMVRP